MFWSLQEAKGKPLRTWKKFISPVRSRPSSSKKAVHFKEDEDTLEKNAKQQHQTGSKEDVKQDDSRLPAINPKSHKESSPTLSLWRDVNVGHS